jgi:epoxyqueuosine reductase
MPGTQVQESPPSATLLANIKAWGSELGFARLGIANIDLSRDEAHFRDWLEKGFNGEMEYLSRHGSKRYRPAELLPGTVSCISVRMDYWPKDAADAESVLAAEPPSGHTGAGSVDLAAVAAHEGAASGRVGHGDGSLGYISRYALGRDYHKLIRQRLQKLCDRIAEAVGPLGYRAFADSAPVLEKALARNAGLGWIGKHTNLIDSKAGSYFFLGEIYLDLELPMDVDSSSHCGTCNACIPACPTGAIVAPYRLDARRCISYLTIELKGPIPTELRRPMGNRIYGCDDCQLACPWNKFARPTREPDFEVRHGLDRTDLPTLFAWTEEEFVEKTRGSAISRIGYERWLRNIAVALGNAPGSVSVIAALRSRQDHPSDLVREHVEWALAEQASRAAST